MAEERRNHSMEPNSERLDPERSDHGIPDPGGSDPEGREASETRLRRIRTTTTATPTSSVSPQDEKTWSILAHVSVFLNAFTGFLGPVGALVIWLVYRDRSPRISFHALQSLWYQVAWIVILAVGWTITAILTAIIIGLLLIPVMIVATVVPFIHMGIAAYKVSQGVDYRYPIVADMIDGGGRNETL